MIWGNYFIQHLQCLHDRFYLLWYLSSMKKNIFLKFFVYKKHPTSVVLNCSYFWCCLLNCSVYTHNLYSKKYSTLFKPLSTLVLCLLLLSVPLLSSQLGIHNTEACKAFVRNVIKEYVTIGDVKIPFELIYQLREIVKVGTLLSAKTTLQIVIGIFY